MSYQAPTVDATGLHISSFQDILDYYTQQFQSIYGQQVDLENDSADFQFISLAALIASDSLNTAQLIFNNAGPVSAVGPALDILVKLNGLTRKPASNSTCLVTLTGTAGTVITNGVVSDVNGNSWNLPVNVTIGGGGTVTVLATAALPGPVTVAASQITGIVTPVAGWTAVTNGSNLPSVGVAVEADSSLRARQAVSTELPSISLIAGTIADLKAVVGVTRINVDENTTSSTNGNGTAGHSIQCVVEGGTNLDVATSIYDNKSIGCGTTGSTSQNVTDPNTGIITAINFNRPTNISVYVTLAVHQLATWNSTLTAAIQNAVLAYLTGLAIGENVSFLGIMAAAMNVNPSLDNPAFNILVSGSAIGTSPSPTLTNDISMTFAQVAQSAPGNVVINFV